MKIILADDHTLFQDTMVEYIKRSDIDAEVITCPDAQSVEEYLKNDDDVQLIMLDLRMPGMDDYLGLRNVREYYPEIPVVIMSGLAEKGDIDVAMELGASGYFSKTLSGSQMLEGIARILAGEIFVSTGEDGEYMPSYQAPEGFKSSQSALQSDAEKKGSVVSIADNIHLTPRETEVLQFLAQGAANKDIARELGLEVVTIKLHVRGVCRKLNAKNRTQAVLNAQQCGLV